MLTVHQAARRKGCDARTVKRAVEVADLKAVKGLLREADVDAWEPQKRRPRLREVEAEQQAAEARAKAAAAPDGEAKVEPLTPAERMKQIQLERAEQEWARDRGLLIPRDEVVKLLADFGHRIRRELQSHPRKMHAAMVASIHCKRCGGAIEGSVIAIEAERYVRDVLRVLADAPLGAK